MRRLALLLLALAVLAGCRAPSKSAGAAPEGGAVATAEVLARADAADGTVDHVVSRCVTCGLAMEGSPQHASSLDGYTLHLCSAECKETFDRAPGTVLARLERPPAP